MGKNSFYDHRALQLILGKDSAVPLENRTLVGVCFLSMLVLSMSVPLSIFLDTPAVFTKVYAFFAVLYLGFYLLARIFKKNLLVICLMVIACCLYICFLWFYDGGMSGRAPILCLLAVILVSPMPKVFLRRVFLVLFIVIQGLLFFVQYYFPDTVSAYQSLEDQFIGNYVMFVFVALVSTALVNYILKNLRKERAQALKAKQRLKESEFLFRILAESTGTAIVLCMKGRIVHANPAAVKLYAYPLDDLKMMAFQNLFIPEDRERIEKKLKSKIPGEKIISGMEAGIQTGDRDVRPVYIEASTIDYFGSPAILVSMIDLTRLKKAETELVYLQQYLADIINSMPSILVGVDAGLNVNQWNRQAEQMTGILMSDAIGKSVFQLLPRLEKESMRIRAAVFAQAVCENIRVTSESEGQTFYEDLTVYPLRGDIAEGAVIRLDEMTEKVRLEEKIIQSEKMLSLGSLAAGMAHEINNPLAGILQNVQLAQTRLSQAIPANMTAAEQAGTNMGAIRSFMENRRIYDQLKNIETAGTRAARIVENMLSFARKGTPKKAYDASELLEKALELARSDYQLKKEHGILEIQVKKEFSPDVSRIYGEENKMIQVFYNIFANAAQAVSSCRETIPAPEMILRVFEKGKMVWIEIEDNGPGMADDVRRRVFEPFFTTREVNQGAGLGLSLSYFIVVKDHEGEILVDSAPGRGAKFTVRLPPA